MDDKDNFIVNEEEQNVPVNPQENPIFSDKPADASDKKNVPSKKKFPEEKIEGNQSDPLKKNTDDSEGYNPNMVPPV